MMVFNINDIELGTPSHAGHKIYLNACYDLPIPNNPLKKKKQHIIFKKNKYDNSDYSRYEVAFSQLAFLLLGKKYTAKQDLVVDAQGKILGVAAEHIHHVIARKESLSPLFYSLDALKFASHLRGKKVISAEEIPVYFLNKLPHGFFAQLIAAEKKGALSIDYRSLASILTGSYTLEEDDLHKGNFGFYIVEKQKRPQVVFFKIDHDLMFANSLMSFYSIRPQHLFYDEHAFDIDAEDLLDFPNLSHSSNTYWPTKLSVIANPWSDKEYNDEMEVEAFARLADNKEFKKAKWLSFYKHILIPSELNEAVLEHCFNKDKAADRAHMALIVQAMTARQAKLKALLFSLPEFRHFIKELAIKEKYNLFREILSACPKLLKPQLSAHLKSQLFAKEYLGYASTIEEGDTALHIAIKLGDFRYEETLGAFAHLINKKNKAGKTPLDCALELLTKQEEAHPQDVRKDLRLTMKYLVQYGASQSRAFKRFNEKEDLENYQFQTPYLNRAMQCTDYALLKELLRDLGEDHRYCLKFQKKIAVACIKQFIACNKDSSLLPAALLRLKKEISEEVPELKYIRQLRSSLWIIRQLRGLYGWTSTQGEINDLVSQALGDVKPARTYTFFTGDKGASSVLLEKSSPSCTV
ncbi:Dot/Icm T4SS effector AnkK/LegA5 [Legionella sp. km772]|uniref:Dot/Icm T4SS effector AnkK/LegA5 n=1 Tax=Legionella sp. km772 TaxID=2498111 RepID=UPI000F8E6E01|nr:Dot/Icm T4SS effector AnkK/LegA5 [Legionella sp. km772]RUR06828.1 ankyrin repeat domain-containing protein [Legionella sp. km772]